MSEYCETCYRYAFLDSGSGGLPYLAQLRLHAPDASCVYLADTINFPYGEKTRDEVIRFASGAVERLLERFSPSVIIVACNTISVAALPALRERFPVPFVGTVPAIKLASSVSKNRKIGLLATARTVCDPYTDDLVSRFAGDCEITRIGDSVLVSRIERELVSGTPELRLEAVRPSIDRFRAAGVDTIILACTHFLHVEREIREAAGPDIQVIDSREGVVQQALRLVPPAQAAGAEGGGTPAGSVQGFTGRGACYITGGVSSEIEARYRAYSDMFRVEWGGVL